METTYTPVVKVIEIRNGGNATISNVTTDVDEGILATDYYDARRSMISYMMETLERNYHYVKFLQPCYCLVPLKNKVLLYCVDVKEKKR